MTNYYDLAPHNQYIEMFYYTVLLVYGNDIAPQTQDEITLCTYLLFIGAFTIAVVFGGITSEMNKALDMHKKYEEIMDYVFFSLAIHDLPPLVCVNCLKYCNMMEESEDVQPQDFVDEFFE